MPSLTIMPNAGLSSVHICCSMLQKCYLLLFFLFLWCFFFFFFAVPIIYREGLRDVGGVAHLGGSHSVPDTLQTDCQPEYLVHLGPVEISSLSCSVWLRQVSSILQPSCATIRSHRLTWLPAPGPCSAMYSWDQPVLKYPGACRFLLSLVNSFVFNFHLNRQTSRNTHFSFHWGFCER